MKVIFSRKGFDSSAGGVPSPIVDRRPISIPIPSNHRSNTTYGQLGLGEVVRRITNDRYTEESLCHHDPMFQRDKCAFGQSGAAQSHLANNGVGVSDVFLFFGLFSELNGKNRHHRLFGFLRIEEVVQVGANPTSADQPSGFVTRHPHTIGLWNPNNTIYVGSGQVAETCERELRLSRSCDQVSLWKVPAWLRAAGLTYHGRENRWFDDETLQVVSRGQEFITDITGNLEANAWLDGILNRIRSCFLKHEEIER